jgi:hypothetical protein
LKKLCRGKYSSLLVQSVSDEEERLGLAPAAPLAGMEGGCETRRGGDDATPEIIEKSLKKHDSLLSL